LGLRLRNDCLNIKLTEQRTVRAGVQYGSHDKQEGSQMSEKSQPTAITKDKPAPDGYTSWPDYWKSQGMPWRWKPEIDEARKTFLGERRAVTPNIEKGIYPFKDIKLDRADVEWLLATYESLGIVGPINRHDYRHLDREGVDLRGADLRGVDLGQ
jgi:hypothetical protein